MTIQGLKSVFFFMLIVFIEILFASCSGKESSHVVISVPTMQCSTCKENIEDALYSIRGVTFVHVSKRDKIAEIDYNSTKTSIVKLENIITSIGYDANDKKADTIAYQNLKDCCKLPKDQKEKISH
jgi:periplasmic mercuric ion binding protein